VKVYICGDRENRKQFRAAEKELRDRGHVPINPVRVMYALPKEINNADFTVVAYELIRICDAVYVLDGAGKCLFARMEEAHAHLLEKNVVKQYHGNTVIGRAYEAPDNT